MTYDLLKAFHIIAMTAWFAGLFYLPRLFVYHAQQIANTSATDVFKVMERKLYRFIMMPAMALTWALGIAMLAINPGWLQGQGWMHAKLGLVLIVTLYHFSLGFFLQRFAEGKENPSERFFRMYNELPTLVLMGAVLLVVLKPF